MWIRHFPVLVRTLPIVLLLSLSADAQARQVNNDFIRVDQFGYRPGDRKVAVIASPQIGFDAPQSYAPQTGDTFEIRKDDGTVVWTGKLSLWKGGETDPLSGDKAWTLDFTGMTIPAGYTGDYYVYDRARGERSVGKFRVSDDVYSDVIRAALRMFYYQRCNTDKPASLAGANWADAASYSGPGQDGEARDVEAQGDASTARDLTGGWWDAGDLNKYAGNTSEAIEALVQAYYERPSAFGDNNSIPESYNGVPDILDEVIWGLQWLKKMQLSDGSVLKKVGNLRTGSGPATPDNRPSKDSRPRYYARASSSSTIQAAGGFAHAALVFKSLPDTRENARLRGAYATELQQRAINAFNHFKNNPVVVKGVPLLDGGTGDSDIDFQNRYAVHVACYLYALTKDRTFADFVKSNYDVEFSPGKQSVKERLAAGTTYDMLLVTALLEFIKVPNPDAAFIETIKTDYRAGLRNIGTYKWDENADPYRAYLNPVDEDWASLSMRTGRV